jgi:phosphoribosylformimino-5-aminoimidazole carboxamide ribotide isomerase
MVEIIPVLDIRGGIAVAGKSGLRDKYLPLQSVFSKSHDPVKIAKSLPFDRLYVADLDGIVNQGPDFRTLRRLSEIKKIMVDIGVRDARDLNSFNDFNCEIILGTETIKNRKVISKALKLFGNRIIISIDLKEDRVLSGFLPENPLEAYQEFTSLGVKRVIFLNISAVGTLKLDFSFIKDLNKAGEILLGGGIAKKDLDDMKNSKVDALLVGTALHKGLLDV